MIGGFETETSVATLTQVTLGAAAIHVVSSRRDRRDRHSWRSLMRPNS